MKIDGRPDPDDVHSTHGGPGIFTLNARDVDDDYDLVIVGAGASGLAAAKWYQDRFGAGLEDPAHRPAARLRRPLAPQRVPHPGRHQRRRRRDDPAQRRDGEPRQHRRVEPAAGRPARHPRLLRSAGRRHARVLRRRPRQLPEHRGRHPERPTGCARCCCSRREDWGTDTVVRAKQGSQTWPDFLATTPYSAEAQAGIARIMTDDDHRLDHAQGRAEDRPGEEGDPRRDHLQAVPHGLRRRERAGDGYLPAHVARPLRAPASRPPRPATRGRSASRASTASASTATSSRASAGPPSRTSMRERRPDASRGRTATRRCCGCSSSKLIPNAIADVDGARPNQENIVIAKCRLHAARPAERTTSGSGSTAPSSASSARERPSAGCATITYVTSGRQGRARARPSTS